MKREEMNKHYTAKNLETIAKKLPESDASKMYRTMEAIARIIVGQAAFCAACAGDPRLKELAILHLNEANLWADFLAKKAEG